MNPSEPFIPNNYIVDESRIDEYIQKKNELMKERKNKAYLNIFSQYSPLVCIIMTFILIYDFV
jgi:hypothetical protein